MKPDEVYVTDVQYHYSGINNIHFYAVYPDHSRRGVIKYDTKKHRFCSHGTDIQLLVAVTNELGQYGQRKTFK